MKRIFAGLFFFLFLGALISSCNRNIQMPAKAANRSAGHSTIMLVLGSSDPATRAVRVDLACDLLKSGDVRFDRIVLSGGCGAHGTAKSNCEASDMQRLLIERCSKEIEHVGIYKEERSLSTVQNYCYSRSLRENGRELIRQKDKLYVVSSHYHALSVAACFRNNDVDARYYYTCGGDLYNDLAPSLERVISANAPCFRDYTGIARNCGNPEWCSGIP